MLGYIILGVIILILIYVFITYNSLVKCRNRVNEAFSVMDVYLKKRWDLIPSIVESVKGYAKHEKEAFTSIIELRNHYDQMNINDKVDTNYKVVDQVNKLMALFEAYPDLKASENFKELSKQLTHVEDEIMNARKYYNATVRIMNDKIEMFPSNIVAKILGFKTFKMFEASETDRQNVKVEL